MHNYYQHNFIKESVKHQKNYLVSYQQNKQKQYKFYHKLPIIALLLGIFLAYRFLHIQPHFKDSINDNLHQWTFSLNRWIAKHASEVSLIIGQLIMEINTLCLTIYWMLAVDNFRYPATVGMFHFLRNIMMKTTRFPFLSYVIWFAPGVNPVSFSYDHTADYYYSGHTGCLMIFCLEAHRLKLPIYVQIYFIVCLIYMICLLLVNRVHYTADVFGGILFSLFCHKSIDDNLVTADSIFSLPSKIYNIISNKIKQNMEQKCHQGTSLYDIQHN